MSKYSLTIIEKGETTSWIVEQNYDEPLFDFFGKLLKHPTLQTHNFIKEYGNVIPATCKGKGKKIEWFDNKGNSISLSKWKVLK